MSEVVVLSLTGFLLARLDEDEAEIQRVPWDAPWIVGLTDPRRLLAEVAAKRAIVERAALADEGNDRLCLGDTVLTELAAVYADHPEYDESWRP